MNRSSYWLLCGFAPPIAALALESASFSLDLRTTSSYQEFPAGAAVSEGFNLNLGGIFEEGAFVSSGFSIDLRESPRESAGTETLRYSALWDGGSGSTVTIAQNGAPIATGLAGEGNRSWSVNRNGTYTLTHTTYTGGVAGKVETAVFIVSGLPFVAGDVTVSNYSGTYDGAAHGIGVTVASGISGATIRYATAKGGPYSTSAQTLKNVGSKTVWCEVSAPGYIPQTNSATITISKRALAVTAHTQRKTVGDADPALTWSAPDLIAGDTLTGALTRDAGEAVGTYAIRQGTLAASSNYTLSFTGAMLEIVPAMALTSISARQRYPWNGLVDVDVAFSGTAGATYRVELSATDRIGGTNLTVATVWRKGTEGAVGNPVDIPAPGTHRLVWNAAADLPAGFVADRVAISAKLLNPIWSFESIPAIDPDDEWAPKTVYHDVQTVVSCGEIENRTPTVRCLTDEWNLASRLGANVVFSGSSMALRLADNDMARRGVYHPIALVTWSDSTNRWRVVTLDYETGAVAFDIKYPYSDGASFNDTRFFTLKGDSRIYSVNARVGYFAVMKSANTDISYGNLGNRYGDDEVGAAVCSYFPKGIPYSDVSGTTVLSALNINTHAGIFFCGVAGVNRKQTVFLGGGSPKIATNSVYSCMKNPTGRYVVPMLGGTNYFTVGHGSSDTNNIQYLRLFAGHFGQRNGQSLDLGGRYREDWPADYDSWSQADKSARIHNWVREPSVAYSKGVAMPDGRRIFLGGAGRDADGKVRMWQDGANIYGHADYPAGHPFESWARRDVTCLLPNGKYCGVDEELGLVVVNPLMGEMYVASDDPVFKKGKMGCQLLPNGKVWIIPYDCEGREFEAGLAICGKLYEVDFGFTRSFSLSSLCSPYLKVAEGDPEPSGIKVGLDPNGGELPGVYAQYYKGANPVYGTLPTPTRSGYTFRGWSTDGTEAGIVATTDSVPQSGIQLKAVWRAE